MYADYNYYHTTYKGFLIPSDNYDYFAERASDELAPYARRIGTNTEEKQTAFKKAQCRIADIMFGDFKSSEYGTAKKGGESVNGYYTVSYTAAAHSEITGLIAEAIRTYLGAWLYRPVKVVY